MGSNNTNEKKPTINLKKEKIKKINTKEIIIKEEIESKFKFLKF